MAYGKYKNIHEVATKYQISVAVENFVQPLPIVLDERFERLRDDLTDALQNLDVKMSEIAINEFLMAPILREIWTRHREMLLSLEPRFLKSRRRFRWVS